MALEIAKNAPAGKYSNVSFLVDEIVSFRSFIFFFHSGGFRTLFIQEYEMMLERCS